MRIAYVVSSLEGGGAALPIPDVAAVMRAHGAQVRVFALSRRDGRAAPALESAGLEPVAAPAGPGDHLRAAAWLLRELRAWPPSLVWTSLTRATVIGQLTARALGAPVVSWQHNAFLRPANLRLLRLTRGLTRLWVADSEAVAALTAARLGAPAERVEVWPLVVARPPPGPPPRWTPGESFRIGSLGRLHPNKGYDVLVAALARVDPAVRAACEVVVGGEGAERAALEAAARAAGVGLAFAGFQPDPAAFLAGCHGYVQPSRAEGLCIAAHQAMAAGLPVVVSSVGEMPATVEPGVSGWVVPPGDPAALADALTAMVRDPAAAARMGAHARARAVERFGPERFAAAGARVMARVAQLAPG